MPTIALTKGYEAIVDAEDFHRLNLHKWTAIEVSGKVYGHRKVVGPNGKPTNEYLHRAAINAPRGAIVDHCDGNGLNNTRANLRLTDAKGNAHNRRLSTKRPNRHGFIGVRREPGNRFRGCVIVGAKYHYTPFVDSPEQAARDRDALAFRLHGPFAVLNFKAA